MKKNILITGSALTMILAVLTTDGFSQRNNYPHNYPPPQQAPVYQNQWGRPAAPFIIVDGDGRRNGYEGRNFDQCFEQRSLTRKQRRKLEKRFGFVPPLVMYVPNSYVSRSGRGEYFTYNNGLVYQKQRDGYFHLDDKYLGDDRDDDRNDRNDRNDNWGHSTRY